MFSVAVAAPLSACQEEEDFWSLSLRRSTAKLHYAVAEALDLPHLGLDIVKDRLLA